MFPLVINYAHVAFGDGIEPAFFSGEFILKMCNIGYKNGKFVDPERPYGSAVSILKLIATFDFSLYSERNTLLNSML